MADPDVTTKWCWGCQAHIPRDAFGKCKSRKDGLNALCRSCANAASKRIRASAPERARKWSRDHYARDPVRGRAKAKRWAERNEKKLAEAKAGAGRLYRERLRLEGKSAERARAKYARNPEPARAAAAKWRMANLDKVRSYVRNRRALRRDAEGAHTASDIEAIWNAQRGRCAYCRCRLSRRSYHVDHIVSLTKRGTNYPRNLQLTCSACNQRKFNKDPIDFARQLGRLL